MLFNRVLPKDIQECIYKAQFPRWCSHVWVLTSGTTNYKTKELRFAGLSQTALLHSAKVVNDYFNISLKDVYLSPLPYFHLGGLAIHARCHLSQAKKVSLKSWSVPCFLETLEKHQVTITSLVPTQVYDLVRKNALAPKSLRQVLVGGAMLSFELYKKAEKLGWNVVPVYSFTEVSGPVAIFSNFENKEAGYKTLEHIKLDLTFENKIKVKGPSVLTSYLYVNEKECVVKEVKKESWFETEDLGEIKDSKLFLKGRTEDIKKVSGEQVNIAHLNSFLEELFLKEFLEGPGFKERGLKDQSLKEKNHNSKRILNKEYKGGEIDFKNTPYKTIKTDTKVVGFI